MWGSGGRRAAAAVGGGPFFCFGRLLRSLLLFPGVGIVSVDVGRMGKWKGLQQGREGGKEGGEGRSLSYLFLWFLESLPAGFPFAWEVPFCP